MEKYYNVVTWKKKDGDEFWEYYGTDRKEALKVAKFFAEEYGENMQIRIYDKDIQAEDCDCFDYDTINRMEYDTKHRADFLEKKYREMISEINRNVVLNDDDDDYSLQNVEHICEVLGDVVKFAQEDYYNFNYDTTKIIDRAEKAVKHLRAFIDLYFYDEGNLFEIEY